jgi:hypothetical protein
MDIVTLWVWLSVWAIIGLRPSIPILRSNKVNRFLMRPNQSMKHGE